MVTWWSLNGYLVCLNSLDGRFGPLDGHFGPLDGHFEPPDGHLDSQDGHLEAFERSIRISAWSFGTS